MNETENLKELFALMDKYRKYPKYQLERNLNVFFALYLPQILKNKKNKNIDCEIENIDCEIEDIFPEFPLLKGDGTKRSINADFAIFAKSNDGKSRKLYLIELKTDMNSLNNTQLENYCNVSNKDKDNDNDNGKDSIKILEELLEIHEKSSKYEKYDSLIKDIKHRYGFFQIDKEKNNQINKTKQNWIINKDKIAELDKDFELIYIVPRSENLKINNKIKVITFDKINKILQKNNDILSIEFNQILKNINRDIVKVRILKGTNQIGGVFTEISTKDEKILIDFGNDLNNEVKKMKINGLTYGKPSYNGVIVTHNHQDHIGRIDEILPEIPVYVSDLSKKIYETAFCFSKKLGKIKRKTTNIENETTFTVKNTNIKITPFLVDHSAYNSFMLLIEVGGKKILHTGDFRNHGYKGKMLSNTLKKIGKVDLLITEGTTFSRSFTKSMTEEELADDIAQKTEKYDQVLMLMSTTNIDRVTTMQKVANKTRKTVIHDIVLSNVLQLVTQKIPNALNSDKVYVFLPNNEYKKRNNQEYKSYIEPFQKKIDATGKKLYGKFIMNVRPSMIKEIEKLKLKNKVLNNCCVVFSTWGGYKEKKDYKKFLDKMEELNIDVLDCHVSGHADYTAFKELIELTNPDAVIPIHTENKEKIKDFTDKAIILDDMEYYEL